MSFGHVCWTEFSTSSTFRNERVVEASMVEYFRKADGSSMGADTLLLAVFPDSLSFARAQRKVFGAPKLDIKHHMLREASSMASEEWDSDNGQGGSRSRPATACGRCFGLGGIGTRAGTQPRTVDSVRSERDGVLSALRLFVMIIVS